MTPIARFHPRLPVGLMIALASLPGRAEPPGAGQVALHWLDRAPPGVPSEVSWGVPWPRGTMPADTSLTVMDAAGNPLPTQTWALAYWPDGTLKWTGLSIVGGPQLAGPLSIARRSSPAPEQGVTVSDNGTSIVISTGPLQCTIDRSGPNLIRSLSVNGSVVGRNGRLVAWREARCESETEVTLRDEKFTSRIERVTVEQAGPVRAVVKIEGRHVGGEPGQAWLPFIVRLYFTAGLSSVRVVHSFIYDGDASRDFIRGLGLSFSVPFREELQNRHIRFAGDGDGVWGEPVLMSPGYREKLVPNAIRMNLRQLAGKRIPNLEELPAKEKRQFESIAVWDGFKLSQLASDSFSLDKRTGPASSWLHVASGRRARGLAFVGDVSGGLAVGIEHFWEKYPAALEVTGASKPAAELTVWLWSPDAPPMDLRHYDTVGHDGSISYEDHQDGYSTPYGVANTSELILWALPGTPSNPALSAMANNANQRPLLVCDPRYYHDTRTLGVWSLPDRSTPDKAALEDALDRAFAFYQGEVDRRKWYGFWDYGDVMRTYDPRRHEWMYDIGGHAWNNTELMPNLWLWYAFLRTGRADIFRFAEAMTRNTSEVDVYHEGPFYGLGSRHNVSHWGCGAKEDRISEALLKRPYYYLTTDERTGDLMREVLTVDQTIVRIQPLRHELVRADVPIIFRVAPDWEALASNWMTEWERTGDIRYRNYVLAGMKSLGRLPSLTHDLGFRYDPQTKELFDIGEPNLRGGGFMMLFGGDQIAMELMQLIDCPEFARAWNRMCERDVESEHGSNYTNPRIAAYVARIENNPDLGRQAWDELRRQLRVFGDDRFPAQPRRIDDSSVLEPVEEIPTLDTPGAAQWALNIITATELAKSYYAQPARVAATNPHLP